MRWLLVFGAPGFLALWTVGLLAVQYFYWRAHR
jgi:hypothetical protein